jgi:anti-sigma regulatory factor (Ser/Thr protein kinase)
LKAGFISAFFQGVVRGMVENKTPISQVFSYFNRFLVHEWSGSQTDAASRFDVSASVSVCAFDINFADRTLSVWNSGFPVPIFTDCHGKSKRCGETASHPLGWFEEESTTLFEQRIDTGGFAYAWTDGLEDLAGQLGVSPISLAEKLLKAKQDGVTPVFLKNCGDDILVVRLNLAPKGTESGGFKPLLFEEYFGPLGAQIDHFQTHWEKSLETALPDIPEAKLFDLLLCSREAVINAIKYGCGATPSGACSYEVTFQPEKRLLRVIVNDPGPGHDFDWAAYEKTAEEQMLDAHRGLILINRLPDLTRLERRGTSVTMDFHLSIDARQP